MLRQLALLTVLLSAASTFAADAPTTRPATQPIVQSADGSILLHSRDVTIHGSTVRYEPKPEKNTVGFWTKKDDWVSWDFTATTPGKYDVIMMQGCGKGSGGAEVEVSLADQTLKFTVEDTGHFQKFIERNIGTVTLAAPGKYTLSVKPITKPGAAVMDLRQVVLKPHSN